MEQLVFIEKQIEELETEISSLLHKTNQVITSIPGIGDTLGAIILSEIGDINRFDAPTKLVAFAGLDVKVTQPGEFVGTKNRISKRGYPYLRRIDCRTFEGQNTIRFQKLQWKIQPSCS